MENNQAQPLQEQEQQQVATQAPGGAPQGGLVEDRRWEVSSPSAP